MSKKVSRDCGTGKFVPKPATTKSPKTTIIQTVKSPKKGKWTAETVDAAARPSRAARKNGVVNVT